MKQRNILLTALLLALLGSISVTAQTVTVDSTVDEGTVSRGGTFKGKIHILIPEGLHINSNKPNSEYAIPTTVRITGAGMKPATIEYPEGTNRKFQFSDIELNVYEGNIVIPFSISVPKNFRGEKLTVNALVRYQACTEEVCYPPANKGITVTTNVR